MAKPLKVELFFFRFLGNIDLITLEDGIETSNKSSKLKIIETLLRKTHLISFVAIERDETNNNGYLGKKKRRSSVSIENTLLKLNSVSLSKFIKFWKCYLFFLRVD